MNVDMLKEIFGVKEDQQLAALFDRDKSAVSVWRKKGVPPGIILKAQTMRAEQDGSRHITQTDNGAIPEELLGAVDAFSQLDPVTRTIVRSVLNELRDLDQAAQWKAAADVLDGLLKKKG